MTPAWFLRVTGAGLIGFGLAGFVLHAIGFDSGYRYFTLTAGENAAHIAAGVFAVSVAAGFRARLKALKWLVVLIGIAALFFAIYGFLGESAEKGGRAGLSFLNGWAVSSLAGPFDNIFHALYAAWALVAAFRAPSATAVAPAGANAQEAAPHEAHART